jgi:copper resistance protein C
MMALRRALTVLLLAALCCVWQSSPAAAHTDVVWTFPAQDVSLPYPPAEVAIRTVDPIDVGLSQIVVRDADGRARQVTDKSLTQGSETIVLALDGRGAWGQWTVDYRLISADGHAIEGRLDFAVGEPARAAADTEAATTRWLVLGGGALALLAAAWYLRWTTSRLSRAEARQATRTR